MKTEECKYYPCGACYREGDDCCDTCDGEMTTLEREEAAKKKGSDLTLPFK